MDHSREHARVLFEKGEEDRYILERIANDPQAPESGIGFHAQQAVEKFIKAVLASRAIPYPRTHNLALLLDMLSDNGLPLPPEPERLTQLTPYGARLRYDRPAPIGQSGGPLDRSWLCTSVRQTRAWAERLLAEPRPEGRGDSSHTQE
jgi:hypothetical protein